LRRRPGSRCAPSTPSSARVKERTARGGSAVRRLGERVLISLINSTDAKTQLRKSNRRSPALRRGWAPALRRRLAAAPMARQTGRVRPMSAYRLQ
jgi:hypothetical protein